jgi:hypothetical protein
LVAVEPNISDFHINSIVPTSHISFQSSFNISMKESNSPIYCVDCESFCFSENEKMRMRVFKIKDVGLVVSANTFPSIVEVSEDNPLECGEPILYHE